MENKIDLRSEEVQDIITQIPRWLLRWGITLIFVLFLGAAGHKLVYQISRCDQGNRGGYYQPCTHQLGKPHLRENSVAEKAK
ncbi:MAG: hypothetical protein ACKOC0_15860 [Cytophagales bacterium]